MAEQNIDVAAELARLRAENEQLKAQANKPLTFKVSEKTKAISIYGLQRFPITLYGEQVDKLFSDENVRALRAFRQAHASELASKADKAG